MHYCTTKSEDKYDGYIKKPGRIISFHFYLLKKIQIIKLNLKKKTEAIQTIKNKINDVDIVVDGDAKGENIENYGQKVLVGARGVVEYVMYNKKLKMNVIGISESGRASLFISYYRELSHIFIEKLKLFRRLKIDHVDDVDEGDTKGKCGHNGPKQMADHVRWMLFEMSQSCLFKMSVLAPLRYNFHISQVRTY